MFPFTILQIPKIHSNSSTLYFRRCDKSFQRRNPMQNSTAESYSDAARARRKRQFPLLKFSFILLAISPQKAAVAPGQKILHACQKNPPKYRAKNSPQRKIWNFTLQKARLETLEGWHFEMNNVIRNEIREKARRFWKVGGSVDEGEIWRGEMGYCWHSMCVWSAR